MNLLNTTVAGLLFASSALLNIANAGLMTVELEEANSSNIINYSKEVNNTYAVTSDAIFTLNLSGDFSGALEYLNITLDEGQSEELDLGNVLDGYTFNDEFNFGEINFFGWTIMSDWGSDSQTLVGTATIAQDVWSNLISDSFIDITLDASDGWLGVGDYKASGNISYSVEDPTNVPEPATLAIFGLALLGFTARRAKK